MSWTHCVKSLRIAKARKHRPGQLRKRSAKSETSYRTIIETIEEGYYEMDRAGNFTFFNDRVCEILGYSRDELGGDELSPDRR